MGGMEGPDAGAKWRREASEASHRMVMGAVFGDRVLFWFRALHLRPLALQAEPLRYLG
jgi:hypothetical protein